MNTDKHNAAVAATTTQKETRHEFHEWTRTKKHSSRKERRENTKTYFRGKIGMGFGFLSAFGFRISGLAGPPCS